MQQFDELDIPRFAPRATPTPSYRMRRRQADGTRRMVMLAAGIGGGALLLIGGWSLLGRGNGPVPVIQADSRPIRVKPEVRGGMQITGANDDLLSGDPAKQTDALAAPTEIPQTEQLRQLQQAELERSRATASAATMFAADPAPANAAEASSPAASPPAASLQTVPTQTVSPQAVPATPPPIVSRVATPTPPTPPMASAAPEVKPAAPRSKLAATEARSAPTEARPTVPEARAIDQPQTTAGKTSVQLAAVGSEAAARQFWQRMTARMPELLGGRKPALTKIGRDGHLFWRVRVDGFADTAAADSFCDQVHGKGGGCSVAAF